MIIRPLHPSDYPEWFALRSTLWPECEQANNENDAHLFISKPHQFAVFVSESAGRLTGFLEASLREYADGCATSPVGYVEGWYLAELSTLGNRSSFGSSG
jgi:aminoglycoside 6'-N-acetyltransferase I